MSGTVCRGARWVGGQHAFESIAGGLGADLDSCLDALPLRHLGEGVKIDRKLQELGLPNQNALKIPLDYYYLNRQVGSTLMKRGRNWINPLDASILESSNIAIWRQATSRSVDESSGVV